MENLSTSDYQNDQMIVYDLVAKTNVTRSKDTRMAGVLNAMREGCTN